MRRFSYLLLLILGSCNNSADSRVNDDKVDSGVTVNLGTDETHVAGSAAVLAPSVTRFSADWELVNDSLAQWPKEDFDYFIMPKRNTSPDYPYIALGDFNNDSRKDAAALIKKKAQDKFELLIIEDYETPNPIYHEWKEDMDLAAISLYPRKRDGNISMKGDGISVEFFEKATWVIYWNGQSYKRDYIAD